MEQPTSNSDGLQPQDLSSSCSLPTVFDLTRNGEEECLLTANSIEALHVVQTPGWYMSPGSSKGIVYQENDTDHLPQPSDQIQPDNAFSNTTVTLSYVSRSHVFSSHNSLSQRSSLYGVPSISKTFTLHPTAYEASTLVTETDGAQICMEMDQHCLQSVSTPLALTSLPESYEFVSPGQVVDNVAGLCYLQQAHERNGIQDVGNIVMPKLKPQQQVDPVESKLSGENGCVQNGSTSGLWSAGPCQEKSPECHTTHLVAEQRADDSEVLFLFSRTEEPAILQDNGTPESFCSSSIREYISPLDDPVSPAATSLDEVAAVFILPQTASSPSGENSFAEEMADVREEELEKGESHPRATESTGLNVPGGFQGSSDMDSILKFNTSNNIQLPVHFPDACKPVLEQGGSSSKTRENISDDLSKKTELTDISHLNGSTLVKEKTFERKKLPPRSGRGMRLEAIVQNINPLWYRASRNTHSTKKSNSSKTQKKESNPSCSDKECSTSADAQYTQKKVCSSEKRTKPNLKTMILQEEDGGVVAKNIYKKESTSDSGNASFSKYLCDRTSPATVKPSLACVKKSDKGPRDISNAKSPVEVGKRKPSPSLEVNKKSPVKQHQAIAGSNGSPMAKKAHAPKRKRKRSKVGQSSIFSPQEPEIKLKYVNYKEEKRDRVETFSPFVHVELKEFPTCTVVNYPEEEKLKLKKGQQPVSAGFISGVVPTTSCLQHSRVSAEGTRQGALVCCLCGGSANAAGNLGDLHGPYYPEGFKPASKVLTNAQGLKEEDYSDSDSSFGARGRKCAAGVPGSWTRRPRHRLPQEAVLGACQIWTSDSDLSHSPTAKRPRVDAAADDWYSPPVVPLDTSEHWLHEDCGMWSAGVFLVKGKLYGLEKAVKMAQETICSTCHKVGATLGCFFKGCPNKYHYTCAVQSDCVLNEDNFSMKCTKHKNKSIKGSSMQRQKAR